MSATGCRVDARRASEIGLCQEVVPAGKALPRALEIAHAMAELPQSALLADRRGILASVSYGLSEGLDFEASVGRDVLREPEVAAHLEARRNRHR